MARNESYEEFVDKFKPKLTTAAEKWTLSDDEWAIIRGLK